MKTCTKCKVEKELTEFNKASREKSGYASSCKMCAKVYYGKNKQRILAQNKAYRQENKELVAARDKAKHLKNKDQRNALSKAYYINNKEHCATLAKEYYKNNKEICDAAAKRYREKYRDRRAVSNKKWGVKNKGKRNAACAKRRAAKLNATPPWADLEHIKRTYEWAKIMEGRTGRKIHIDHIYPLQGENVCGLHCEANLQLMFAEDNCSKGNKF